VPLSRGLLGHELIKNGRQFMQPVQVSPDQLLQDLLAVIGQPDPRVSAAISAFRARWC
jgi:hypothetical protein